MIRQIEFSGNDHDHFVYSLDHPELGPATLIGIREPPSLNWEVVLFQPRTGVERVIYRWNPKDVSVQWPNSGAFLVTRVLPLTPLLALGYSGLPDMVNMGFYSYLGYDDFKYASLRMTLVQVHSSLDGHLISSCVLPSQVGVHVGALLINEGRHLLLNCRANSDPLGKYFTARSTVPEEQPKLASMMPPLAIMDCQSGEIIKTWPGLGQCSLDQIDDHTFFHCSNDVEPVKHWASSRPDKLQFRILDTQTQTLTRLKRIEGTFAEAAATRHRDGFLMQSIKSVHDTAQQTMHSTIFTSSIDRSGTLLAKNSLVLHGGAYAQLIPGQRQILISQRHAMPWYETWGNWVKRWPWLKHIHQAYSSRWWVWDAETGENHLVTTSHLNKYEATSDGKYFLVGQRDVDYNTTELSVYALPFPPLRWWAIWVPRVAGVAVVVLVFLVVVRVFPGHRRGSVPERISSSYGKAQVQYQF